MTGDNREERISHAIDDLRAQFGAQAVRELTDLFLAESLVLLDALSSAIQERDLVTAASRAHGLKSIAGNFGAATLVDLAGRVEKVAKSGAYLELQPSFHDVSQETMLVREAIIGVLSELI